VMGIDKMFIGFLGSVSTTFGLLGYALYFFKAHKFNLRRMLYFTVLFSASTTLCYLWIPSKWTLLTYNVMFGSIGAITHLIILAYSAKITPDGNEGFTFAIITSVLNLGAAGSGLLGGALYERFCMYFSQLMAYNILVVISAVFTFACLFFIPYLKIGESKLRLQ